ncbi:hypothetical protein KC326_g135 [Hortaea werneckii]|nr:hypothetical protein KC326_g135 [Hortaea werneckii]
MGFRLTWLASAAPLTAKFPSPAAALLTSCPMARDAKLGIWPPASSACLWHRRQGPSRDQRGATHSGLEVTTGDGLLQGLDRRSMYLASSCLDASVGRIMNVQNMLVRKYLASCPPAARPASLYFT